MTSAYTFILLRLCKELFFFLLMGFNILLPLKIEVKYLIFFTIKVYKSFLSDLKVDKQTKKIKALNKKKFSVKCLKTRRLKQLPNFDCYLQVKVTFTQQFKKLDLVAEPK